jgi:hypothetical protein
VFDWKCWLGAVVKTVTVSDPGTSQYLRRRLLCPPDRSPHGDSSLPNGSEHRLPTEDRVFDGRRDAGRWRGARRSRGNATSEDLVQPLRKRELEDDPVVWRTEMLHMRVIGIAAKY